MFLLSEKLLGERPAYNVSVCAVFQNEELFIKEWIDHHLTLKVEHFYLYDNLSTDRSRAFLQPYIDQGIVELFEISREALNQQEYLEYVQLFAYNHALKMAQTSSKWIAYIDIDEFIVPHLHDDLQEFLGEYMDYAGIAINWQVFGTSGIDDPPESGRLIEHLLWKGEEQLSINQLVKLVVQPTRIREIGNPHSFSLYPGEVIVNSRREPLFPGQITQCIDRGIIQINHYWFGTKNWFIQNKIPRREKWGIKLPLTALEDLIDLYNQVLDDSILKFISKNKPPSTPRAPRRIYPM